MPSQLFYPVVELLAVLISCLGLAARAFAGFTTCDVDGFRLKNAGAILLPGPECSLRLPGDEEFSNCIGRLATVLKITPGRAYNAKQTVSGCDPGEVRSLPDEYLPPSGPGQRPCV